MQHTLREIDSGYECSVCRRDWKRSPDDDCVGVQMYPFGEFDGLMTANQLGIMGYRSDRTHLPPPAGYYWRKASKRPRRPAGPVFLYNPAQAVKKTPTTKQRVRKGMSVIAWPRALLYLLDDYLEWDREGKEAPGFPWIGYQERKNRLSDDILRCASGLTFAEFDEALTGPCVEIPFPPVFFRRRYERPTADEDLIVVRLVQGYKQICEEKQSI